MMSNHQFWTFQQGDPCSPMHLELFAPEFEGEDSFG